MLKRRNSVQIDNWVGVNNPVVNEVERDANVIFQQASEFVERLEAARLEYASEMLMHANSVTVIQKKIGKLVVPNNSPAITFSFPSSHSIPEMELSSESSFIPCEQTEEEMNDNRSSLVKSPDPVEGFCFR